jgi:hypothetical protein
LSAAIGLASIVQRSIASRNGNGGWRCMASDDEGISIVANAIARYLSSHPKAADSVEGIRRWWLAPLRYDEAVTVVQHALDRLLAEGVVAREAMPDGRVIYRRAAVEGARSWSTQ